MKGEEKMQKKDQPIPGKVYSLTGKKGDKCIANGNTWSESEFIEEKDTEIKMPFPDARDQHLINKNLNKATGGK